MLLKIHIFERKVETFVVLDEIRGIKIHYMVGNFFGPHIM